MNLNLLGGFLEIAERALQRPQDRAAVKIAIDGLAAWRAISSNPLIAQLEADISAYLATLPAAPQAVAPDPDPQPSADYPGARGRLMPPGM